MLDHCEPPRRSAPTSVNLSHVKALERGLLTITGLRKRDRTRARLLWATGRVLEDRGYDRTRVADIAAVAGVSASAFYPYFIDREDAARQFFLQFVEQMFVTEDGLAAGGTSALRQAILGELAFARANRGLLRAMSQALETEPALGSLLAQRRANWVRLVDAGLDMTCEVAVASVKFVPGLRDALDAMVCGAQRRMVDRRVTEVEMKTLAAAMAQIWCAGRITSVGHACFN